MENLDDNKLNQQGGEMENQGKNFSSIPPQISNRNLKISIGVFIFLLITIVGVTSFYIFKNKKNAPGDRQTTTENNQDLLPTFQNFASGKVVLYYNRDGVFQFDSNAKQKIQIVTLPVMSYGSPALSQDNTKIVFYTNTGDNNYDLWLYDIVGKNLQKLLTGVSLYSGYIQNPVWAKNSKSVFVTIKENETNKLYSVDLSGNKSQIDPNYSGNAFWPKAINDDFLAFNTSLPDGNTIGIVDTKNNRVYLFNTLTTAYFAEVKNYNNSAFLKVGNPVLSNVGATDKTKIFGLEKLELSSSQVKTFSIPAVVKIESDFKRIQPIVSCGDQVLLGQVIIDKGQDNYFGESHNKFYVFNAKDSSMKEMSVPAQNRAISAFKGIQCDINQSIHKAYFQNDFNETDPISITVVDLINPDNVQTVSYSDLLPQNVREIINNGCVYSTIGVVSNGNEDFVYINLNSNVFRPDENKCKHDDVVSIAGIYRLSKKENSISKVVDDGENFLIVPEF